MEISEKKKVGLGLTESYVEAILLKSCESFFTKMVARNYKVEMHNGLTKPNNILIKKVASRLKVLN